MTVVGRAERHARLVLGRRSLRARCGAARSSRARSTRRRRWCATARTCSTSAASRRARARATCPAEVEIARTAPLIEALAKRFAAPLSIDTRKARGRARPRSTRARAIVNDVSGLRHDPALAGVVARAGAALDARPPARRARDDAGARRASTTWSREVADELRESLARARGRGRRRARGSRSTRASASASGSRTTSRCSRGSARCATRLGAARAGRPLAQGVPRAAHRRRRSTSATRATPAACAIAVFAGADAVRVHDVAGAARARRRSARALRDARAGRARGVIETLWGAAARALELPRRELRSGARHDRHRARHARRSTGCCC